MDGVERDEPPHPVGRAQAEVESHPSAELVPDHKNAVELERIQQRENVVYERRGVVALARSIGAAEPAKVRAEHPVARRQQRDQVPPGLPVLGPAVQEQDGLAGATLDHVHA
jgi:hypothetical protein